MKKLFLIFLLIPISAFADYITNDIIASCDKAYAYSAIFAPKTRTCSSGNYLPANSLTCEECPSGYTCSGGTYDFNADNFSGATYTSTITSNMNNICASNTPQLFKAVFSPKTIICSAGYYLPADAIACIQCPANSYCVGGTYTFNETTNQGIIACATGYSSSAGSSSAADCVANTITVRWDDGNGGAYSTTCTYDSTLTTPSTPPIAPHGYHFTGWTFN